MKNLFIANHTGSTFYRFSIFHSNCFYFIGTSIQPSAIPIAMIAISFGTCTDIYFGITLHL